MLAQSIAGDWISWDTHSRNFIYTFLVNNMSNPILASKQYDDLMHEYSAFGVLGFICNDYDKIHMQYLLSQIKQITTARHYHSPGELD